MKRVLIHFPQDRIAPKGGPAGYLYSLRLGLEQIGAEGFDFLPPAGSTYEQNSTLKRIVPKFVKDARRLHNLLALPDKSLPPKVDYSAYECLHFHSTEDLFLHRKALESYEGKVILTSHSPCVYHQELIARLNLRDARRKADELRSVACLDEYAFQRADWVVFPCSEAEEPYFHTWKEYSSIRNEAKLRYLLTGTQRCSAKVGRGQVRSRYNIPEDAFVLCYVGRHNSIKGYDALKEVVLPLLDADERVWVVAAGKVGPLLPPNHKRWVEVGWTSDPHSIVAASDVFVLPNRETFFDLVLLEVLSLGVPIVATKTGGNKFFERFNTPGIQLYSDSSELLAAVSLIRNMSVEARQSVAEANKRLFEDTFTCSHFARRYSALIGGLCG